MAKREQRAVTKRRNKHRSWKVWYPEPRYGIISHPRRSEKMPPPITILYVLAEYVQGARQRMIRYREGESDGWRRFEGWRVAKVFVDPDIRILWGKFRLGKSEIARDPSPQMLDCQSRDGFPLVLLVKWYIQGIERNCFRNHQTLPERMENSEIVEMLLCCLPSKICLAVLQKMSMEKKTCCNAHKTACFRRTKILMSDNLIETHKRIRKPSEDGDDERIRTVPETPLKAILNTPLFSSFYL